ncbi:MAG: efflux RND transporter periplasmic adaptor subunit [Anaerolineales bacterium]|nr:efflux RND transporter periplasmic adaptor subunit [Anaerolineales bacterium]MCB8952903.1 efflux RND transporter periplasmic adaptor subunit [Ardenticatenales bacterium]
MKRYFILCLTLMALVLGGCRQSSSRLSTTPTPNASANTPTPQPTRAAQTGVTVLAEGQIVAVNPVLPLGFQTGGHLLTLAVQAGDTVAAGDLIATLADDALQDAVTNAQLQLAQAENSLAQAQASLDTLRNWEADELAVAAAEANLAAAEAGYQAAQAQDAAAGNTLTSARISVDQARQGVADAQEAYDTAWDPARDWELNDPFRADRLKAERDATTRRLEGARQNLEVAQAQYNLALAGLQDDAALKARVSVVTAQQSLDQARRGPTEADIAAAELKVEQAELAREQSEFSLAQAQKALAQARLLAPWGGTILSVEVAAGALVGTGSPIVTLLDTNHLQFQTTNVSERDLAQIVAGLPVEIVLKAFPDQPVAGRVARVAPQASGAVGDAAVFAVMIDLPPTDLALRPGMTGRAEIRE